VAGASAPGFTSGPGFAAAPAEVFVRDDAAAPPAPAAAALAVESAPPGAPMPTNGHPPDGSHAMPAASDPHGPQDLGPPPGCTAPQLRRFIKSRPYVPMHELRRRFGINGGEDDVTLVDLGSERIYVGLPMREGALLGELLRGGEIGYELSLDPRTPVVIGLYPMRPVARA
jgi:hypothetical protein